MLQEIIKTVYGAGKGNLDDKNRIGSVYHNLGIVNGILRRRSVSRKKVWPSHAERRRSPLGL